MDGQASGTDLSTSPQAAAESAGAELHVERGVCYVLFAFDIGFSVNLDEAERRLAETSERRTIRGKRHAPAWFEYDPPPVRVNLGIAPVAVGAFATADSLEAMLYDFGVISVTYRIPLRGTLADLLAMSDELYDNEELLGRARRHVQDLLSAIMPAVTKPQLSELVEDYVIYQIESLSPEMAPARIVHEHASLLAQILRAERVPLSEQEVHDALACRLSFGADDVVLVDWNAAAVFDTDADDVRGVLEYANVELLEMRYLDDQLDRALEESYAGLAKPTSIWKVLWTSPSGRMRRIAELHMDAAVLFEGVNNALKLVGDQYLARLYRAVSQRLHLEDWDASILRKLQSLDSIYEKMVGHASNRRLEVLEWIIIFLIAFSTLVSVLLTLMVY